MKSSWKISLFLALVLPLAWIGCQEKGEDLPKPPPVGGVGGEATLRVIPRFDGVDVDSCMIYIIYNSLDNTEIFDDSLPVKRVEGSRPYAEFTRLNPGNYYLFGKGWDIQRSVPVWGGVAHTIEEAEAFRLLELDLRQ